jgi:hypothetical protein
MSADLEIQNGTVSYAQAEGEPAPWWKGADEIKTLPRTATRREWELAANFNFDITMEEMVTLVGDTLLKDQDRIVRPVRQWRGGPNDGQYDLLGNPRTERYGLVTPTEMLDFADTIVDLAKESGIEDPYLATLGSVRNGNRNFVSVYLGTMRVTAGNGWNDETKGYLSISNSYDGTSPFAVSNDDIRIVCSNTQKMVLRNVEKIMKAEKGTLRGDFISGKAVRLRHLKNVHDRIADALQAIAEHNQWKVAYEAYAQKLMQTKITNKQFDAMVKALALTDTGGAENGHAVQNNERKNAELHSAWVTESKNRSGMNAWSALNAFTYMTSHLSVAKGNDLSIGKKLELRHGLADTTYNKLVIDLTDKVNDYMLDKFIKV